MAKRVRRKSRIKYGVSHDELTCEPFFTWCSDAWQVSERTTRVLLWFEGIESFCTVCENDASSPCSHGVAVNGVHDVAAYQPIGYFMGFYNLQWAHPLVVRAVHLCPAGVSNPIVIRIDPNTTYSVQGHRHLQRTLLTPPP
jgi:hypothetical protein